MVNFSPLTAEIGSGVWGAPANFNGFRVLAALLHGTLVLGISQTLWHWTEDSWFVKCSVVGEELVNLIEMFVNWNWSLSKVMMNLRTDIVSKIVTTEIEI